MRAGYGRFNFVIINRKIKQINIIDGDTIRQHEIESVSLVMSFVNWLSCVSNRGGHTLQEFGLQATFHPKKHVRIVTRNDIVTRRSWLSARNKCLKLFLLLARQQYSYSGNIHVPISEILKKGQNNIILKECFFFYLIMGKRYHISRCMTSLGPGSC